ncbi:MAG: energy-coupling factor ABC transporter substrate-binding protein, partial [Propionibacterium freudenreichii]
MSEATITNPGAGAPNPTTPASDTSGHGLFAADRKWVTPVLVVALVVIFVGSLIIGGIRTAGQDETFVG